MKLIVIALALSLLIPAISRANDLTLIVTGDTRGEVWPCDCQVPGGLTKRAAVMRALRSEATERGAAVIAVDLGNFAGHSLEGSVSDEALFQVLEALDYDALLLGPEDCPTCDEDMGDIMAHVGAPLLSAFGRSDGTWLTCRVDRDETSVTLLGWPSDMMREVGDLTALQSTAAAASAASDLTVLLSPLSETALRSGLSQIEGIDVVVCRAEFDSDGPEWERGRLWATLRGGDEVGYLHVSLAAPHQVTAFSMERVLLMADIEDDPEIALIASMASNESDPDPELEPSGPARLEVEALGLQWDEVPEGSTVHGQIILSNPGASPISIRTMRSTCRCVRLDDFIREIPPGGRQTVDVVIDTRGVQGDYSEAVIITSRDRQQPVRTLPVGGRVVPRVDGGAP